MSGMSFGPVFTVKPLSLALMLMMGAAAPSFAAADSPKNVYRYELAAGSMDTTLTRIARQAGKVIIVDPQLVKGLTATEVRGELTMEQAFAKALQNTDLMLTTSDDGVLGLKQKIKTAKLQTVKVSAEVLVDGITEGSGSYSTASMNTASKLDLSTRETPQSVSVISNQLIEDQQVNSIYDALALVPGINTGGNGPSNQAAFSRGFQLTNLQIDGQNFSRINGYDNYLFTTFNTASIDHIEVVRGATGISGGNGAPSGTVNVVRKRADKEFHAKLKGAFANYKTSEAEFDVTGALSSSGNVRGRFVADYEDQQDHIQDYYSKTKSQLYGVLDIDITSSTLLSVSLDYQDIDVDGLATYRSVPTFFDDFTVFDSARSLNLSPEWEQADQQQNAVFVSLTQQLANDWKIVAAYTARKGELHYRFLENQGPINVTTGNYSVYATRFDTDITADVYDLSASGTFELFSREHKIIIGYNGSDRHYDDVNYWEGSSLPTASIKNFNPGIYPEPEWWKVQALDTDAKQSSLYANTQLKLTDSLAVLLGMRLSNYEQDEQVKYDDYDYDGSGGQGYSQADYNHDNVFTPFAGVVYDLNQQISLYVSYAEIFSIQDDSVRDINGDLLDPVESVNLELGAKAELFDNSMTASAALFHIEQDNYAVIGGEFTDPKDNRKKNYYKGVDGATSEGIEFEISGQVSPNWQLMGGITHQRLKDATKTSVNFFPENILKFSTRYNFTDSKFSIGGVVYVQSSTDADRTFNGRTVNIAQDDYVLADIWGEYRATDSFTLALNVKNLFDKKYRTDYANFTNWGEARRIKLSATYRF